MRMPLDDVKVLDLSHALAGPFCSTMLADFGADVIKLEPTGAGDIARAWGPPLPGGETSYFVSLHRNKKGIEVDLKHPRGKELFFRLVERCDVVLENYRVGALARLGLGYEAARERNAGIIYCSVSGFGQDGPYRDRAALDLILQAESGMISVTGEPGGHGVRCGVSIADLTAGMYAAFGILLALRVKERTGRGQAIDVSMLEGQLSLLGTMIGGYLADGQLPEPMGTAYKALLPYQTFRTRTRDLALAVGSEKLWKVFCPVIGCPALADDPRYRTNADRAKNRESLVAKLQEVFLARSYEEWEGLLLASGIPVGAINTLAEVVEHPQVAARQALVEMDHPRAGTVRMVGAPVRLSETPGSVRTPAPTLGEHTDRVLRELLGLDADEVASLRATGAIGPKR
ncbi:MAG TPA: CoA transferase [Methylomirabilota bacterium]|jgi:formyl-CoA transferase/CoA:oxalate CoA-transferase|nr:CoA transferase [Methylomirabilota bacterium]